MANKRMILLPVLLITLGLTSYYVETGRKKQRSALTGFIESQPTLAAGRIQGRVKQVFVHEGDAVKAGDPLLELETEPDRQDAEARDAQQEQAGQALRELKNGSRVEDIAKQRAAVAEAAAQLTRLKNGPLPEEIAQAEARLARAMAALMKLRHGSRPEEIEAARAAHSLAEAKLAQAQRGLTTQEREEARARFESAASTEELARREAARYEELFRQDAVSRQQSEVKQTDLRSASAKRREMEQAWNLARTGTPREEMEQARQTELQARANLALVVAGARKEDIAAAEAEAQDAAMAVKLLKRGARSEDIAASQNRVREAQSVMDSLLTGARVEQIAQATAAAKVASHTAGAANSRLAEHVIRAPISGVVERIPVSVGDLLSAGTTAVRIANPGDEWLRIYVPEASLHQIHIGDIASIKIDGVEAEFEMKVESVATVGEFTPANLQTPEERGKQVFWVRLRPTKQDARLKTGIAVTVKRIGAWTP